jgi:hypothetical protein
MDHMKKIFYVVYKQKVSNSIQTPSTTGQNLMFVKIGHKK